MSPTRNLKLLNLADLLVEADGVTDFESVDLAVHMIFLAASHSYEITREIAVAAQDAGFEGLIYPSYFSLLRTGAMPFESIFGLSQRRLPRLADSERLKIVPNYALFGTTKFDKLVKDRRIPRPKRIDSRVMWNRFTVGAAGTDLRDEVRANPLDRMQER